jgi:hypothetical protein
MTEVIKDIKGFEGRYTISNLGIVRSLLTNQIMKPYITNKGYARVNLRYAKSRDYKSFLIHRLVAMNFLPNPHNFKEINHKDCNRLNNKLDNLEWCDRFYNIKYAFLKGKASNKGVRNPNAKLNKNDIIAIKAMIKTDRFFYTDIARLFKVSSSTIEGIANNKIWSNN